MQEVVIARQIGNQVVVGKGLTGSEQVIADVPPSLTVGAAVKVRGPGGSDGKEEPEAGKGKKDGKPKDAPGKDVAGKEIKS